MSQMDAVSQDEIDAILLGIGSLAPGTLPEQDDVQPFDVQALAHLQRGPLPGLDVVNLRFARYLRSGLQAWLGRDAQVQPAPVHQLPFAAMQASLPAGAHCTTLEWSGQLPSGAPSQTQGASMRLEALLVVEPALAFSTIDLALGGSAQIPAFHLAPAPSPVGQRLLCQLANVVAHAGGQAWAGMLGLQCKVEQVEPVSPPLHIATDAERMVASHFQIKLGDQVGGLAFWYPWLTLAPLAAALRNPSAGDFVHPATGANAHWAAQLATRLQEVRLPLVARWRGHSHSMAQAARLAVGDIISLDGHPGLYAAAEDASEFDTNAVHAALLGGSLRTAQGQTALQVERWS